MILVTGATGKTGRSLIRALTAKKEPVRALVRGDSHVQSMEKLRVSSIIVGDMRKPETLRKAFDGIKAVYHICPNVHPDEISIGALAINTAKEARVEKFVYHSVLHPQIEAMPHHWSKLRVEEMLFESGLPFTILQPAAYMQNLLAYWHSIVKDRIFPIPYSAQTRICMVDLEEVSKVGALVLTEARHDGAIYELCGPEALSQTEVAKILGEQLGFEIDIKEVPLSDWELNARKQGLGDYQIRTLIRMFAYYRDHDFKGNAFVLQSLLGHPPSTFEDFVKRTATKPEI